MLNIVNQQKLLFYHNKNINIYLQTFLNIIKNIHLILKLYNPILIYSNFSWKIF